MTENISGEANSNKSMRDTSLGKEQTYMLQVESLAAVFERFEIKKFRPHELIQDKCNLFLKAA